MPRRRPLLPVGRGGASPGERAGTSDGRAAPSLASKAMVYILFKFCLTLQLISRVREGWPIKQTPVCLDWRKYPYTC